MAKKNYLIIAVVFIAATTGVVIYAQQQRSKDKHDSTQKMDERGDKVMGFDHLKTTHHFRLTADGGVIQVEANAAADKESRAQIQQHLRHIAAMFSNGNFSAPMLIHRRNPPGADVMKRLQDKIKYEFSETDLGAVIKIATSDKEALSAIHDFLRFQIKEHETGDPLEINEKRESNAR